MPISEHIISIYRDHEISHRGNYLEIPVSSNRCNPPGGAAVDFSNLDMILAIVKIDAWQGPEEVIEPHRHFHLLAKSRSNWF
jgi:hypothetical protein